MQGRADKAVLATIFLLRSVFHPKTLHLSTACPKRHPATETSDGKKTEKTACTGHQCDVIRQVVFFFRCLIMPQEADGELRSLKKIRRHPSYTIIRVLSVISIFPVIIIPSILLVCDDCTQANRKSVQECFGTIFEGIYFELLKTGRF